MCVCVLLPSLYITWYISSLALGLQISSLALGLQISSLALGLQISSLALSTFRAIKRLRIHYQNSLLQMSLFLYIFPTYIFEYLSAYVRERARESERATYEPLSNMGWIQLVGSIKSYISFAQEPYKRDDILQKRHIISSILLTVATPYLYKYRPFYIYSPRILGNLCTYILYIYKFSISLRMSESERASSRISSRFYIGLFCKRAL